MARAALIRRLGGALLSAVLVSCGGASPAPVEVPRPRTTPVAPAEHEPANVAQIDDIDWRVVRSKNNSLELPLPMATQWQAGDDAHWFVATHERTQSELRVRVWRAGRRVTHAECEQQLRLWRPATPDPLDDPEGVIAERRLDAPESFSVKLWLGVRRAEQSEVLEGYALAIGTTIGRCYAAVFVTHANGAGAEAAIGRRLALLSDGVLARVHHVGVEDRIR